MKLAVGDIVICDKRKCEVVDTFPEEGLTVGLRRCDTGTTFSAFRDKITSYPATGVKPLLTVDAKERKGIPIATGVLDYFPAALIEIAKISKAGNDQHNPGEPLHWARGKSMDQDDTIIRHFMERGTIDVDGCRHSAKLAWRALAMLQLELEAAGAPKARGAK